MKREFNRIVISRNGTLNVERAGEIKPVRCKYDSRAMCSDSCASFGEPYRETEKYLEGSASWFPVLKERETGRTIIDLCDFSVVTKNFVDLRWEKFIDGGKDETKSE